MRKIPSESREFYIGYYEKHFGLFFPDTLYMERNIIRSAAVVELVNRRVFSRLANVSMMLFVAYCLCLLIICAPSVRCEASACVCLCVCVCVYVCVLVRETTGKLPIKNWRNMAGMCYGDISLQI